MKHFLCSLRISVHLLCVLLCITLLTGCVGSRTESTIPSTTVVPTPPTTVILPSNQQQLNWTMDAKIVDESSRLISNGTITVRGTITKKYNAKDSIRLEIIFPYHTQYVVWPEGLLGYEDLSNGMLAPYYIFSVHINDRIEKTSGLFAAALDAEAECAIFCLSEAPVRYLVASTNPEVDSKSVMEHFQNFLQTYPYLNIGS